MYYVPDSNHTSVVRRAVYSATRNLGELTKGITTTCYRKQPCSS